MLDSYYVESENLFYVLDLVSADKCVLSGTSTVDPYNAQHRKSALRDGKVHGSSNCYRTLRVFDQQVSISVLKTLSNILDVAFFKNKQK